MKKLAFLFGLLLCVLLLVVLSGARQEAELASAEEFVPNEVLLKFKEETAKTSVIDVLNSIQAAIITSDGVEIGAAAWDPRAAAKRSFALSPDILHIRVPESIGTLKAIGLLKSIPAVDYAETNSISHIFVDPNDTRFSELWGLKNTGQTGGTADADIDAPEAWDIFTGSDDMVVAVIDTGIAYTHPDLQDNIWINEDEIPGNGIDDDGNGKIDDYRGWNFADNNNNVTDDFYPIYHGTHVAGTIGAKGNNDLGVMGVNWTVKLMAVKAGNYNGALTAANIASAIEYAVTNGARVLNNSYGGTTYSQTVYQSIRQAQLAGCLFVAAAGNYPGLSQKNNDITPVYPASYDVENIVAVLATDQFDNLATYSHYGKTSVDIGAPGGTNNPAYPQGNILSTSAGTAYQQLHGTSMATPHVAGVAALAWGMHPSMTFHQLKTRILDKVDVLPSLNNKCVSNGRVNAYKVVYDAATPDTPTNLVAVATGWNTIRLNWQDQSDDEVGFEVQRKRQGEGDFSYLSGYIPDTEQAQDMAATAGLSHSYRLKAFNMAGDSAFTNEASATIPTGAPSEPLNPEATYDIDVRHAVHLTWSDVSSNEQYFIVERKADGEAEWSELAALSQNAAFYDDSQVSVDTTYHYRIKATNPDGSSYSEEISIYIPVY